MGRVPLAPRQREAWWRRIEELHDQAEQLDMTDGAVEEAVNLWLHIADRHPEPAAQADCYRRVLSLCPGEPRALEALAELHELAGEWEQAVGLLSMLADSTGSSPRRAELEHRVGHIKWQHLGDEQRAEVHFLHAFAMHGSHLPSVEALVQIYQARGDWESAAEVLLRVEARTESLSLRLELLFEAACIHRDHLRSSRAAELLEALLAIDPGYLPGVEALADIYRREKEWEPAAPLLEPLEGNGAAWPESAVPHRSCPEREILSADPGEVDDLCSAAGWPLCEEPDELEIVVELEEDPPVEDPPVEDPREEDRTCPELEILSADPDEVGDPQPAAGSPRGEQPDEGKSEVELEQDLREEDRTCPELEIGVDPDELVARARAKLNEDPRHARSYRTLRAIFTSRGQYDQAWCVCAAMSYLGCASPRERLYYETYKPRRVAERGETLTGEMWDRVVHPGVDPRVGVIARAIGRELALAHARPIHHHGLSAKDRRDISNDQLALSRALERAAAWLQVPLPDLYLEPDEPGGLSLENVVHRGQLSPSLLARGNALRGRTPGELACIAGHTLAFLRPDFYLMVALPTEAEFRATWEATLALSRPLAKARRGSDVTVESARSSLERALSSRARAELALAVSGSGLCFDNLEIPAWRSAVAITAQRIGLILCGDPAVAVRTLLDATAPATASPRSVEIDPLLVYAVSEEYFAVRAQLGGTIDAPCSTSEVRPAA